VRWYNDGYADQTADVYIDGVFQQSVTATTKACSSAKQYEKTGL
jgi:hypothetical protein